MHYNGCNYLSMLGLKLNHVSKRGHWLFDGLEKNESIGHSYRGESMAISGFDRSECAKPKCLEGWIFGLLSKLSCNIVVLFLIYSLINQTSITIRVLIGNYIHVKWRKVISHPCHNINSGSVEPLLTLGHGWVIESCRIPGCNYLSIS